MSEKSNNSIKEKTDKLNKLIAWFDSEDFSLEEAIDKFKEAEKMASDIENDLNNLKNEVKIIKTKLEDNK